MSFKVLIDLGKLKKPFSGLGQFSYYFGRHIKRKFEAAINWNFLIPQSSKEILPINYSYETLSLKRRFLPFISKKYDLWHAIHQDSAYMPSNRSTPYILTIHDLNFLKEKGRRAASRRLERLQEKVNRASAITFVSKYTASVAQKHLKMAGKETHIIYNGVDIETSGKFPKPLYLPESKFLFSIGMILKKKNFHVLIDFIEQIEGYSLIIAGDDSGSYAKSIRKLIRKKNLGKRVILPGIISNQDRIYLYQNCSAFLFPSLMEGFGLPVIEAMRFGKPVYISTFSSLPEIGGDLAYYWDNFNPESMRDVFLDNQIKYERDFSFLSKRISEYSFQFNWEDSIEKYISLYKKTLENQYPDFKNTLNDFSIKVLHISTERSWKGGEQQIAYLIDELESLGVKNYIACDKDSVFETYCIKKGWPYHAFKLHTSFSISAARKISIICKKYDIDIIHLHGSVGHTLGVMSTYFGHSAKLVLSRRVDYPVKNNLLSKFKYNHAKIAKIISVSSAIKKIMDARLNDKNNCIVIHDGINPARFNNIKNKGNIRKRFKVEDNTVIIGNTSALADHKDYYTFINTAEYLLDKELNAIFIIVGDGPERLGIEKYIKAKGLEDKIKLLGFVDNIPEILPEFDVFLMTSKTEGLGSSILDAFACGVPVIATNAGGIPEAVINENTGLSAEVKDYTSLGEQVIRLLNDDSLRLKIVKNAREHLLTNFTTKKTGEKTFKVYNEIIGRSI